MSEKDEVVEKLKQSQLLPEVLVVPEEHRAMVDELEENLHVSALAVKLANKDHYHRHNDFWNYLREQVFPESTMTTTTYVDGKVFLRRPSYEELEREVRLLKKMFVKDQKYSLAAEMRDMEKLVSDVQDLIQTEPGVLVEAHLTLKTMIQDVSREMAKKHGFQWDGPAGEEPGGGEQPS